MDSKEYNDMKKTLEAELLNVEKKIFEFETYYINKTYKFGNILKGFDNYVSTKIYNNKNNLNSNKANKILDSERLFSQSSFTSPLSDNKYEDELEKNLNSSLYSNHNSFIKKRISKNKIELKDDLDVIKKKKEKKKRKDKKKKNK